MIKLALTLCLAIITLVGYSQTKNFLDQPYIEVNGNVDSLVTPNEIFIQIIISEKDTRDKYSVEELEGKMVSALKLLGLDIDKDLAMNDMFSNTRYYFLRGKDIVKTKRYTLKVKDAVTATNVFIKLEELNISNTSISRVGHSNLEGLKNVLRTKAIETAKAKAIALTQPLNQTVGVAIFISDNENLNNIYQGSLNEVVVTGYGRRRTEEDEDKVQSLPNIEFQKIKVTVNINVKFLLR